MSSKSFVFALRPTHQEMIQSRQGFAKGRRPEASVVANPTEKHRPKPLHNICQGKIVAVMQLPAAHLLTHRLSCFTADRWCETDEQFPSITGKAQQVVHGHGGLTPYNLLMDVMRR